MRGACAVGVAAGILLSSLAAGAISWKETDWSAQLAPDPRTGAMSVYFSVWMEYEPTPSATELVAEWASLAFDANEENLTGSVAFYSSGGELRHIVVMSPAIPIESGKRYGARLSLADRANGLTFAREFQYLAPTAVPISVRLEGWTGQNAVDLTGVPDEELEDLVTMARGLRAAQRATEPVSLETFLTAPLPPEEAFPALVLLVPTAGVSTTVGPAGQGVKITVGQMLYVFTVPTADAVAALREQTDSYPQPILGTSYSGSSDLGIAVAVRVFLDEVAVEVLEAVEREWQRRAGG